jgi:hypothetical protein
MSRACTVCSHPRRKQIDIALVGGTSNRTVARHFGLSEPSVRRHLDAHVSASLKLAAQGEKEAEALDLAGDLASQVRQIRDRAASILQKVETAGDNKTGLAACRELCRCIELLGRFAGDLTEGGGSAPVIVFYRGREPPPPGWIDQQVPGHTGSVVSLPEKRTVLLMPDNGRDRLDTDG